MTFCLSLSSLFCLSVRLSLLDTLCCIFYLTYFIFWWYWGLNSGPQNCSADAELRLQHSSWTLGDKQLGAPLRNCRLPSSCSSFSTHFISLFPPTPSLPFVTYRKRKIFLLSFSHCSRQSLDAYFSWFQPSVERVLLLKDCKVNCINSKPIFCNYILL